MSQPKLLPLEVFSGPYRQYLETGDVTALHAWADWMRDTFPHVPGVEEAGACVGARSRPGDDHLEAAVAAAPYLLPTRTGSPEDQWFGASQFPDVTLAARWRRTTVSVVFEDGLPEHVCAPVSWLQVFEPAGRFRQIVERYPRVRLRPLIDPDDLQPAWAAGARMYRVGEWLILRDFGGPNAAKILPHVLDVTGGDEAYYTPVEAADALGRAVKKYVESAAAGA